MNTFQIWLEDGSSIITNIGATLTETIKEYTGATFQFNDGIKLSWVMIEKIGIGFCDIFTHKEKEIK